MLINGGVPFENRTPLDAALEYYAFRISLGLGKTIGGNACDGCDVPMTITLNQIQVFQPTDCKECNPVITTPDLRNTVSWNGKPLGPVTVPVAPKTLALARAVGVDAHTVNVSFTLPRVSTAKLELFDVSGRLRASRSIEGLAPGDHDLSFAAQQPLGPGVYFVRLAQDGEKVSRRFSLRY
jgi:hypothetical protein